MYERNVLKKYEFSGYSFVVYIDTKWRPGKCLGFYFLCFY